MSSRFQLVVVGDCVADTFDLPHSGDVVVGRDRGATIVVPHRTVSRRHVILRTEDGVVTVEDLGSRNGTEIAGVRLQPGRRLAVVPGTTVRVGDIAILLRATDDAHDFTGTTLIRIPEKKHSDAMTRLYETLEQVAPASINVLILGETGAGKGVLARALHVRSPRADKPFVPLSCAAFPEALLEAELFGYEKGAYTGAQHEKPGLLETADKGTVFLDEVAELSATTQAKLLKVIEDKQVLRLGALAPRPINARFVSATNRDLEVEVEAGRFRKDLYFRLNGVTFLVPPLRERAKEIEGLARHFAESLSKELGRTPPALTSDVFDALKEHAWPGNVRELKNVVERSILLSNGGPITREHLGLSRTATPASESERARVANVAQARGGTAEGAPRLRDDLDALEREKILSTLEACGGNQSRAAKALGISRSTLLERLERYGAPRPRKKRPH
jgi:DNA-binding NtrC family response regulator